MYKTQIPVSLEESGSITWTISTEDPARPTTLSKQLPISRELAKISSPTFDGTKRREVYGELLFTITDGKTSRGLSNTIDFEIGKIITESDIELLTIAIADIPDNIETVHNTSRIDLSKMGLSASEIISIRTSTNNKLKELREELAITKRNLDNTNNDIIETQKLINETNTSIMALEVVEGTSGTNAGSDVLDKLILRFNDLEQQKADLLVLQSELSDSVGNLFSSIDSVSKLVI